MSVNEFLGLREGMHIIKRHGDGTCYRIENLDCFGNHSQVYGAIEIDTDQLGYVRIDKQNCQFWDIIWL